MEKLDVIIQFIGSVGFPIVMSLLLLKQNSELGSILDRNTEALIELKMIVSRTTAGGE